MSHLVSLLVIACAVPLAVTWDCTYIQKAAPPRVFSFMKSNNNSGIINSAIKDAQLVVQDMCMQDGAVVVGVKFQICDEEAPTVSIPYEFPIWSLSVFRTKYWSRSATVNIRQYCQKCETCNTDTCIHPPGSSENVLTYDMFDELTTPMTCSS